MEITLNNVVLLFSATNKETPYEEFSNCCMQNTYAWCCTENLYTSLQIWAHGAHTWSRGTKNTLEGRRGVRGGLNITAGFGRLGVNWLKSSQTKKTLKNYVIFTRRYIKTRSWENKKIEIFPKGKATQNEQKKLENVKVTHYIKKLKLKLSSLLSLKTNLASRC